MQAQPAPFNVIQSTPHKQPLQAVVGIISAVYKHEVKQGNYGPYTQQNVVIKEPGSGLELRCSIFDADGFTPQQIGQTLMLTWGQNSKGQWGGLFADHYTPTQGQNAGRTIFGVAAKKSSQLFLNGQPFVGVPMTTPMPAPTPAQPPMQGFPQQPMMAVPQMGFPQQPAVTQPLPQTQPVMLAPPVSPIAFLAGQAAAYVMCYESALGIREQLMTQLEQGPGEPLSTTDLKDIATSMFIEGNKRGIFATVVGNPSHMPPYEGEDNPSPFPTGEGNN